MGIATKLQDVCVETSVYARMAPSGCVSVESSSAAPLFSRTIRQCFNPLHAQCLSILSVVVQSVPDVRAVLSGILQVACRWWL